MKLSLTKQTQTSYICANIFMKLSKLFSSPSYNKFLIDRESIFLVSNKFASETMTIIDIYIYIYGMFLPLT